MGQTEDQNGNPITSSTSRLLLFTSHLSPTLTSGRPRMASEKEAAIAAASLPSDSPTMYVYEIPTK